MPFCRAVSQKTGAEKKKKTHTVAHWEGHAYKGTRYTETEYVLLMVSFNGTAGSGRLKDVGVAHTTNIKVSLQGIHGEHLYIQGTRA